MILSIVPELTDEEVTKCGDNVKVMDYNMFNSIEFHPFIATHKWERVDVVLQKGIVSGYLRQVISCTQNVRAIIRKGTPIDFAIISKLIELYPNDGAELRSACMQKKDITDILKREGVVVE